MASGSTKAQQTDHEGGGGGGGSAPTTLAHVLLILKFLPRKFCHSLVSFTSVPQTSRLLITCTELYTAKKVVLQKLPVVCDKLVFDPFREFKLYRLTVRVPNSRWFEWLDTSGVEELKLPTSVKDEEMLIMFSGERFSELRTLNLWCCFNITDASVLEVARRCSNLQTLNLCRCSNITDASVLEVARRCSNLQTLNLWGCSNITDASVLEVARGCSNLQTLNLSGCRNITDTSVLEVARRCSNQTFYLIGCSNITSACKNILRQSHPKLRLRDW